mmetsp:Transcript_37742/g.108270  ORF Transcript_37742/g.108270 Transcript_37742/m.108270 type:complete len:81 (-) Transcript_37742:122-364(-)
MIATRVTCVLEKNLSAERGAPAGDDPRATGVMAATQTEPWSVFKDLTAWFDERAWKDRAEQEQEEAEEEEQEGLFSCLGL